MSHVCCRASIMSISRVYMRLSARIWPQSASIMGISRISMRLSARIWPQNASKISISHVCIICIRLGARTCCLHLHWCTCIGALAWFPRSAPHSKQHEHQPRSYKAWCQNLAPKCEHHEHQPSIMRHSRICTRLCAP